MNIADIVVKAQRGDRNALQALFTDSYKSVYFFALRLVKNPADAEDITQEVFLSFVRCQIKFADEEHIKAWLIRAAVNRSVSQTNSVWVKRRAELDESVAAPQREEEFLRPLVMELPEKYRAALLLHYYEDMTAEEIAKIMGRQPGTVYALLSRGRAMLRKKLVSEEGCTHA